MLSFHNNESIKAMLVSRMDINLIDPNGTP